MDIQSLLTVVIEIAFALFLFITIVGLIDTFVNAFCEAHRNYLQKLFNEQYQFLLNFADYSQLLDAAKSLDLTDQLPNSEKTTLAHAIATYQLAVAF